IICGSLRDLGLPQICKARTPVSGLIVRSESPWETYQQDIRLELAGPMIVAHRRSRPFKKVAIRELRKNITYEFINRLRFISHENVLFPREIYLSGNSTYGLYEIVPFALEQLVNCPDLYPTEAQLSSIMGQILDGIYFLSGCGLTHRHLSCREVLLGLDGIIKIACLESCMEYPSHQAATQYVTSLPSIVMSLMHKTEKHDCRADVGEINRWPADSRAFKFLCAVSSAQNIEFLQSQYLVAAGTRNLGEVVKLVHKIQSALYYPLEDFF
ncbi:hypothetical protein N7476_005013, partial [Penicillium atrosanguineum]